MDARGWAATLVVAGLVLVLVGVLLGTVPSSVGVANPTDCGAPWAPEAPNTWAAPSQAASQCTAALGMRGSIGLVVLLLGGLTLVGVCLVQLLAAKLTAPRAAEAG